VSEIKEYRRKVSPLERLFTRSPFSTVTMVARIKGNITEDLLLSAVSKVQQRHQNLRVRIMEDDDHVPWFTSEEVGEIPVEIVSRQSDDDWIRVHQDVYKVPFEFDKRPAIRFVLVRSPELSELIILCHHIICDGMSLAYLARDLMVYLGDPEREAEVLPDPVVIDRNSIPKEVPLNPVAGFFINRINKKWEADKVFFDQKDYEELNKAYWDNFTHNLLSVELSETETSALVDRCRKEGVTVNSALTAAVAGAQQIVQGDQPHLSKIGVASSLRDRLQTPAGEAMGFYAGIVNLKFKFDNKKDFWENTRKLHQKVKPLFTNKNLFKDFLVWCILEPTILEAINFKKLGGLVSPGSSRYQKLSAFSQQDDVVLSILKRDRIDSLDKAIMGSGITNLTRMGFPRQYGVFELDRLIMQPGGAFPLVSINLVLGVVTCSGKLSIIFEYAEEAVDSSTMEKVKTRALEYLLNE
jgi:NRPS condensation-like uncharacterized protein